MATKILGNKLYLTDLKPLLALAKGASQRRIVKSLFNYQLNQIENRSISGIDSCKQLHNAWLTWITGGCKPNEIKPIGFHHGYKARLQYAQRLYLKLKRGNDHLATKWRNVVTTVLRSYQVCGPSSQEIQDTWSDSLKSEITRTLSDNVHIGLIRGCCGIPSRYNDDCDAKIVYECASAVRDYFNKIERINPARRTGFYKALSSMTLDISVDDYSQLLKRGPHTVMSQYSQAELRKQRRQYYRNNSSHVKKFREPDPVPEGIPSIFGQALDVHALSEHHPSLKKVDQLLVWNDREKLKAIPESDLYDLTSVEDKSLLDYVNQINEAILLSYKKSNRGRNVDISYSPLIPQNEVPEQLTVLPGRGVVLADKAGKCRPIGIVTYTVNNALAPLHNALQSTLGLIRQDCSYQPKGVQTIVNWTQIPDIFISSADLSAATDNIPIVLSAYILYRVLKLSNISESLAIAKCWYILLGGTPYKDPFSSDFYRYGRGQGMGAYTSWSAGLALFNHIMIRTAFWKAHGNRKLNRRYIVCGDDTVIADKSAFELYERWMNALGVTINRNKSHICHEHDDLKVAEFCKRLVVNGEIVSGFSPKLLIRAWREGGRPFREAAISCMQDIVGPLNRKTFAKLVNVSRVGRQKLHIPCRYGGWGQIDSEPFHEVMLEDYFIFLFVYKRMRSSVNLVDQVYQIERDDARHSLIDQRHIDALARHRDANLYRNSELDWRSMGRKSYKTSSLVKSYLYDYECFLTGRVTFSTDELIHCIKEAFARLNDEMHRIRLSSKDDDLYRSNLALKTQHEYTRAMRSSRQGKCHTYAFGVQEIDPMIDLPEEVPVLLVLKDLVNSIDHLLFTEEICEGLR